MSGRLIAAADEKAPGAVTSAPDPREVILAANEIMLVVLCLGCVAVAYAFPFPAVKYGLMSFFGIMLLLQTLRRPAVGLALLAFAVPAFDLIPTDLIPIPAVNAETLMILYALFIWARANRMGGKEGVACPTGRIVLIYALMIIASAVHSWLSWQTSLFNVLAWSKNHLAYLVFLPVSFHVLRSRRDQVLVLIACTASLFLNAISAIDHSFMAFVTGTLERHRASALLATQENIFGGAMALYLPMLVVLGTNRLRSRFLTLWFLFGSAVVSFALLLTLSRGAWIAAVGGLLAVALFRARKLLIIFAIAALSYQLWVPAQMVERVKQTTEETGDLAVAQVADDSTQMRIEQYKSLPAMMYSSPVIGSGYKTFSEMFRRYGTLRRAKGAHSSYCQIGTEEGAVGLLVLLLIFASLIRHAVAATRLLEDPLYIWLAVGILGGAVSMLLCMASGARFEAQRVFFYFWIIVGMVERELVFARAAAEAPQAGPALALSEREGKGA